MNKSKKENIRIIRGIQIKRKKEFNTSIIGLNKVGHTEKVLDWNHVGINISSLMDAKNRRICIKIINLFEKAIMAKLQPRKNLYRKLRKTKIEKLMKSKNIDIN